MVELKNRRIIVDGKPVLILSGEIHYFRLKQSEWEDRILKAKQIGCNAIASYIPWIVHEQAEGDIDVTGRNRKEHNIGEFIDLCHKHGLWFIARPGPFIMAEMKNEGIPFWVRSKYPEVIPVSWEGKKVETKTLDYLSPTFLKLAERWYGGIIPVLASRLHSKGGPVIGIQLDNEIGMLSWVSNQPDLSDDTLCDFSAWLISNDRSTKYPFDLNDPAPRVAAIRNPAPEYGAALLRDYGDFERVRFAKYVATLRGFCEKLGVSEIPYIVNIHGSGGGRAQQYPIGISQLMETYTQSTGYLSGSDHYLGDLTRTNAQDLYVINSFMEAVHRPEQPLSSMEFEVGDGNYGETGVPMYGEAAADHKVRMSIAQGNRLLNYYLLTGGRNPKLLVPNRDGNDRVATTGERHGFAAPISPEGVYTKHAKALETTTKSMSAIGELLADMDEERDDIELGFIPDYYKTNFRRQGPMQEIVENLEYIRGPLELLSRGMMQMGFRFSAVNLQSNPPQKKTLAIASSRYMDQAIQLRLVDFLHEGGSLFLWGEFPVLDMEGKECTVLAKALGIRQGKFLQANDNYYMSTYGVGLLKDEPEVRVWRSQTVTGAKDPILKLRDSNEDSGFVMQAGKGRVAAVMCNYPVHMDLFRSIFRWLSCKPGLTISEENGGLVVLTTANAKAERMIHVLNLDVEAKHITLKENGQSLFSGEEIHLGSRGALALPLNIQRGSTKIRWATTELTQLGEHSLTLRAIGTQVVLCVESSANLRITNGVASKTRNEQIIRSVRNDLPVSVSW